MPVVNFEIHICPECGSVSVGRMICNICATSTVGTSLTVQDLVNDNVGNTKVVKTALDTLSAKYSNVTKWEKYADIKKANRKYFLSDTWKKLKRKVRVCPKCGHIAGASCFYDNNICCICGTTYVDSKINCQEYYNREEESDAYLEIKQEKLREKLCLKSAFFDAVAWEQRIDIEKDRLPIRLETQLNDYSTLPNAGILPSLLNIPDEVRAGKEQVWNFFIAFQSYLLKHIFLLDNATEAERAKYLAQLREFLSDAFNIMRIQSFLGQQHAADMIIEYIVSLDRQICNDGEKINLANQ